MTNFNAERSFVNSKLSASVDALGQRDDYADDYEENIANEMEF